MNVTNNPADSLISIVWPLSMIRKQKILIKSFLYFFFAATTTQSIKSHETYGNYQAWMREGKPPKRETTKHDCTPNKLFPEHTSKRAGRVLVSRKRRGSTPVMKNKNKNGTLTSWWCWCCALQKACWYRFRWYLLALAVACSSGK